ncbi:hypothetical protein EMCRGX_G024318 [Ephydatia muelleri]
MDEFESSVLLPVSKSQCTSDPLPPKDLRSKYKYNIFCRLFICWADPLLWLGFHKSLEQGDLFAHPEESDSESLLKDFNKVWSKEMEKKKIGGNASLSIAIFRCLWWRIIVQGILFFIETAAFVYQSILLGDTTQYFSLSNPSPEDTTRAYLNATGLVVISVSLSLVHAHTYLIAQKLGMMASIILTGAIYQKTLHLSHATLAHITTGHVINLASNDVQRFEPVFSYAHTVWMSGIMVSVVTWLGYREIGPSIFVIMTCVLLLTPLQVGVARVYTKLRFKSALLTDKRVKVMNEVISGMRVIKMYAWEHAFKGVVTRLRKQEVAIILRAALIKAFNLGLYNIAIEVMLFLAFSSYAAGGGGVVTPGRVFTVFILTFYLRLVCIELFGLAIHAVSDMWVSVVRIQGLLELSDDIEGFVASKQLTGHPRVLVDHMTASWGHDRDKLVLRDVSFEVTPVAPLLAVVGPVGAGKVRKSTLLQCLLGELKPLDGTVDVSGGRVSYASQDPWVFSGTLRENILFGSCFDSEWYTEVIEACALIKDIEQLPNKDHTLIGERGVTLSGGQKARVNLARAIYQRAELYLLDDPLSAVDTVVARHIFEKCIRGLLKDSLVVLVTHQLQFAEQAHMVLAMNHGVVEAHGTIEDMQACGINMSVLLGKTGEEEGHASCIRDDVWSGANADSTFKPIDPTVMATFEQGSGLDFQVDESAQAILPQTEESAHGGISAMTYIKYFRAGAGWPLLLCTTAIFVAGETAIVLSNWWLADWASCTTQNASSAVNITMTTGTCALDPQQRIGVMGGATAIAVALAFVRIFLISWIFVNAGRVLHNRMFSSMMRVPIRFYDTNPSGRILNRFSKDIGLMDDVLTALFAELLMQIFHFVAIIVTAAVANPWMLITMAILTVAIYTLCKYYFTTSRAVKRLEAIARSPVYSHITMTLQGLSTIRALGKEGVVVGQYHRHMNALSQGSYLYLVINRWFGIRIDLLSTVFLACVAYSAVPLASVFSPSLLSLGLSYTSTLVGEFQSCVRWAAEVENTMVSAERVMQYSALRPEAPLETIPPITKPPPSWPQRGEIKLDGVSFRYSEDTPTVLKSLSCTIKAAEKVGIVGRTGAGKSSLVALLFRLAEPCAGTVTIDGVQTSKIGLHDLRKKISIIPQDPVLFSGSVRYNLDPFEEYQDQQLWDVLEQVQLKAVMEGLEGGLENQVSEGGSNFSVGQRQLVCLARALLRKNKILVLDEATANIDLKTDGIIQSAIRGSFCECTVLTIAHRLNTVMDCDRILVMDNGQIVEYDEPGVLLQDPNSLLKTMVERTGPSLSRKLYRIAMDKFEVKKKLLKTVVERTGFSASSKLYQIAMD